MMDALQRIAALISKEFLMVLLDPKSRIVIIIPPLIQFFIYGYAATYDLNNVEIAVFDESNSTESRELLRRFTGSPNFKVTRELSSSSQVAPLINKESVRLVLHIPSDFSKKINSGTTAKVQAIVDGRNANVALTALGYVESIIQDYSANMVQQSATGSNVSQVLLIQRSWFNENMESRWYIVSALGGIISMIVVMVLASLSVAREREFGTFDQLLVAPFRTHEILIGKTAPCLFFGLAESLLLSAAGVWWFGIPMRGTVTALVIALSVFMIAVVGVGLFISSISTTMQQGLLGSFVFIMPAVLLGGFTTPIQNMPHWLQVATYINPLRYVVEASRAIFLMGADTAAIWPDIWPLLIISCVTMPAAAVMFRARTG